MLTQVAGMRYLGQLGLPRPQGLRPKIKEKGRPLLFQLTAHATRGPRPEYWAKWLQLPGFWAAWFSGQQGSGLPAVLHGQLQRQVPQKATLT